MGVLKNWASWKANRKDQILSGKLIEAESCWTNRECLYIVQGSNRAWSCLVIFSSLQPIQGMGIEIKISFQIWVSKYNSFKIEHLYILPLDTMFMNLISIPDQFPSSPKKTIIKDNCFPLWPLQIQVSDMRAAKQDLDKACLFKTNLESCQYPHLRTPFLNS